MILGEIASLIRSKNAGPFLLTFDIMFDSEEKYISVVDSGIITKKLFSDCYRITIDKIEIHFYKPALAIKVTIPRIIASGDPFDTDVFGGQQYGPLVNLQLE